MNKLELIKQTSDAYQEIEYKNIKIHKFTVSKEDVRRQKIIAAMSCVYEDYFDFDAGEYVSLNIGGELVMSNTPMEIRTNSEFMNEAFGDVMIVGLGLGIILFEIAKKPNVNSITVIEKNSDLIDLIKPILPHYIKNKLTIINGDIYDIDIKEKFDSLYFDIWNTIKGDNYPQMKELTKKFRKNRNKNSILMHWRKNDCKIRFYE